MRLFDALKILQNTDATLPRFEVYLACGCTPLHLQTFLAAALQLRLPSHRAQVSVGMFGNLAGNIGQMTEGSASAGVVLLEWPDLDPRLGIRRVSGWNWKDLPTIADDARHMLQRLKRMLLAAAERQRVVVCLPTLPFPLLSSNNPATISPMQADVELALAEMRSQLLQHPSITVLKPAIFGEHIFDPAGELSFGFPYALSHASSLAKQIAEVVCIAPSKKGVITDLDLTVWNGILGEDGVDGVHWDLEHHAQSYGIYQQLLHALAKEGVLIAAASKNNAEAVQRIFTQREDLILKKEDIFPLVANWRPKSEIVGNILKTWNVGADSVVFIEDNAFELEEVGRKFPEMECIRFDPSPRFVMHLWQDLRVKFARRTVSEEDRIRSTSIRVMVESKQLSNDNVDMEEFLERLEATLKFDFSRNSGDERAFELINKTNQFNLNGVRLTDAEFRSYLAQEGSFLLTVSYSDKFGSLGKVSSLLGRIKGDEILVDSWVLSCRAFSRRIEFACLLALFDFCSAQQIQILWRRTDRNSYLQEFLSQLPGETIEASIKIDREKFRRACPALHLTTTSNTAKELEIQA
ncbi:MAG TPA: HAD-IIIC family phosphatase [Acidobacteriaceae bacterium]|jgi:FkbH-like protein|nr:HAD-IIIC family phosphatase [Acidobacteriaceae bacterium]